MKRSLAAILGVVLLASCSSSSSKKPADGGGKTATESLLPVAAGGKALSGAVEIVSIKPLPGGLGHAVVLRATGGAVNAFVLRRWFADGSGQREFRVELDGWLPLQIPAGSEVTLQARSPYPFATTLGLDFAAKKPAAPAGTGKALPGRLVVTPDQAAKLKLFQYPDLFLTQYESRKHAKAPKLAVWRDGKGKVVAALEIHVRADAKPVGGGMKFLHTNGKKTIGASLVHAESKMGAPGEGWDFVIFSQAGGREVAVPWKPLVRNASYLGACSGSTLGLDAAELGSSAQMASVSADGTLATEKISLEPPTWSLANPTAGSLSSGAPVLCEYSGTKAQRWSIETDSAMTFTGNEGGSCGTLPAGSGATELGTLRAASPGTHKFSYTCEDLQADPASDDRLLTSDGPVCPGDAASEATEVIADSAKACTSDVPGCTTNPLGDFTELVIPCSSAGGTRVREVKQEDEEPGFVAVVTDGEETDEDMGFMAVPWEEEEVPGTWYNCQDDSGNGFGEVMDGCTCVECNLIVVIGASWKKYGGAKGWDERKAEMDQTAREQFDNPPAVNGRPDAGKRARWEGLLGGEALYHDVDHSNGAEILDMAIHAAKRYADAMAAANADPHFHVLKYESLPKGGGPATAMEFTRGERRARRGMKTKGPAGPNSLVSHFANCHKWHSIMFIYHGDEDAFTGVVNEFKRMITTPVRRIVFWSCWGAERIDINNADFQGLVAHLRASKCNCPGRRPATPVPPAAHNASNCTECPLGPPEHCRWEGTTVITAGTFSVDARARDNDPPRNVDISIPLGIDFRNGGFVLTSPDGTVRVITIPREGPVTEATQRGGNIFGTTGLDTDAGLGWTGIRRNAAKLGQGLSPERKAALGERLGRVYGPR